MLLTVLLVTVSATPLKVALMPLSYGEGATEKTAEALTDAVAGELRRYSGVTLVTPQEIQSVLGAQRQRELLGCKSDSCVAEIAGALDVDALVVGSVAKLGQSWLLHLSRVDARKGTSTAHADRRQKGGSIDDVLDQLPAMVHELMPDRALATGAAPPEPRVVEAPRPTAAALPPSIADQPYEGPAPKLSLATDGKGHYLAFVPFDIDAPLFAGDAHGLYLQRVIGGGSEGGKSFEQYFWEPRVRSRGEATFEFRDGKYTLTCGKKKVELTAVPDDKAASLLKSTKLYKVRWQRHGYALARDDEGTYFYVDQALEPEENTDFRLYVGPKGAVVGQTAEEIANDSDGQVLGAQGGKLRISHQPQEAEWMTPEGRRKLKLLDVSDNAAMIYTGLGAYKGEPLGTPCDGVL